MSHAAVLFKSLTLFTAHPAAPTSTNVIKCGVCFVCIIFLNIFRLQTPAQIILKNILAHNLMLYLKEYLEFYLHLKLAIKSKMCLWDRYCHVLVALCVIHGQKVY